MTDLFRQAVDAWRAANAARLRAMTTAELRIRYKASRVLRHAPDILAMGETIDPVDMTTTMLAATHALRLLKDDLAGPLTESLIADLLDAPRLPDPILSESAQINDDEERGTIGQPATNADSQIAPLKTNEAWFHETFNDIEAGIYDYLAPNRWNAIGSHFGSIIGEYNDIALPTLLNGQQPFSQKLSYDSAVFISLLKTGLVPDHTDDPAAVVDWFEDLQLWIETNNKTEIPPTVIKELAEAHHVDLLPIAPQPETAPE